MHWYESMTEAQSALLVALVGFAGLIYTQIKSNKGLKKYASELAEEQKAYTYITMERLNGNLTNLIHSIPQPCWLKFTYKHPVTKRTEFRMGECNDAYGEAFGITPDEYKNKTDLEAGWSAEESKRFYTHDMQVLISGDAQYFTETVDGFDLQFMKCRVQSKDGEHVGVFGQAVPNESYNNYLAWKNAPPGTGGKADDDKYRDHV